MRKWKKNQEFSEEITGDSLRFAEEIFESSHEILKDYKNR